MHPRLEVMAFLADCKENPDDDTPRLVLADWLEEQGDGRGEFVRLQVRGGDAAREAEVLGRNRAAWLGALAEKNIRTVFKRGLVAAFGGKRKLLSKRLAPMPAHEAFAWVDDLCVHDASAEDVPALATSPHWRQLTRLWLQGGPYFADHLIDPATVGRGKGDWSGLASLPLLAGLTGLNLSCQDAGAAGARVLAASGLPRLRDLDLRCNNLGDEGAAALAASGTLTALADLDLSQNRIRADGFAALAGWRGLASVTRLDLGKNYPGAAGVAALAASRHLGRVTELWLRGEDFPMPDWYGPDGFGPVGAAALAGASRLKWLRSLRSA